LYALQLLCVVSVYSRPSCRVTTEFLEKGAYVEADIIRQMKQV
jgi:hypothetical protein